jgi:asparagine synthase (glutamine-hydrolysing)
MDRASMAISLEVRVPILDHRIIEFSFKVPHNLKSKNGTQKYILKQLAYKYISKELLDRPKQGFAIPILQWIKTDMHYLIDELLNDNFIKRQGIFNPRTIKSLLFHFESQQNYNYGNYIWNLLVFQMWYKKYFNL